MYLEPVTSHKMRYVELNESNVKLTTAVGCTLLEIPAIAAPHD